MGRGRLQKGVGETPAHYGRGWNALGQAKRRSCPWLGQDGRPQAERRVREAFALEAIARESDVQVDEAALEERLAELAEAQGVTPEKFRETAEEQGWIHAIREQLLDQAVFGFLAEKAQVKDVEPTIETSGGDAETD